MSYHALLYVKLLSNRKSAKVRGWDADLPEIAKKIAALPKASKRLERTVIITQGPNPIIVSYKGSCLRYPVPTLQTIKDTTGAGDSFVGGFLAKLIQESPIEDCVGKSDYLLG